MHPSWTCAAVASSAGRPSGSLPVTKGGRPDDRQFSHACVLLGDAPLEGAMSFRTGGPETRSGWTGFLLVDFIFPILIANKPIHGTKGDDRCS